MWPATGTSYQTIRVPQAYGATYKALSTTKPTLREAVPKLPTTGSFVYAKSSPNKKDPHTRSLSEHFLEVVDQ